MIKITGRCMAADTVANAIREVSGVRFVDGGVRLEMRVVSGTDRAQLQLRFRDQGTGAGSYYVVRLTPHTGTLALLKSDLAAGGDDTPLAVVLVAVVAFLVGRGRFGRR